MTITFRRPSPGNMRPLGHALLLLLLMQAVLLLAAPAAICQAQTGMQSSVTQRGITWTFDKQYQVGQFANGDFWVLGPVTITRITPDFDGTSNGWEVNPIVNGGQGFQYKAGFGFDASLVPALPYTTSGTVSIVKTTPTDLSGHALIKSAAVLTVVAEVPPGNGAQVFRPPYVGSDKPYYYVADLKTHLLPSFEPVTPMPTLASVAQRFSTLQMDHKRGVIGRGMRPADNMNDYQPKNTPAQNEAALRLMMNDSLQDKMPALIQYVQFGIDKIHTIYLGQTWPDGGGHQPGHLIVAAFAAVMLDITDAKETLRQATFFHGSRWLSRGRDGLVLWGGPATESAYWNYIITGSGSRSNKDPYGFIDGGKASEGSYQLITSQSHKGEILATHLMPALKQAWPPGEWEMVKEYADRWVTVGQWTLPDPMAPYDGNPQNYRITYGPDPENPGMGILGSGRYPATHGAHTDGGQYRSAYVAAMWNAYRDAAAPPADLTVDSWAVAVSHGAVQHVTAVTDGYIEPRIGGLREVHVLFSRPLDAATVGTAALSIVGDTSGDLSHLLQSVMLDGDRSIKAILSAPLPDAERFTIAINQLLLDQDGGPVTGQSQLRLAALAGDVDGSAEVTAADVTAVRAKAAAEVSAADTRFDVDRSGAISGSDMQAVRNRLGNRLP